MPREKIKFALRILPETQQIVKDFYPADITRIFSATPEKRKIQCANRQNIPYLV